jgi:predicted Zn-dependent protease
VRCVGDVLYVEGTEHVAVPVDTIAVSTGGFDDDTMFLSWQQAGAEYMLTIADAGAQRALAAAAPPSLLPRIKRGRSVVNYHRRKWQTVLAVLGVAGLAVLLAYWQSDAIVRWVAGKVSLQTEQRIGKEMLAQLQTEYELTQEGQAAQTIKAIGEKLTAGSRYQYQWYLLQDKDINAFAVPSGIIVVSSGLIAKATSADELAGVLAHEVAHVERRHTLQQMIHTAGWAAVLTVVLGDVSALAAVFVHQVGNLRYSRKLETEADIDGLQTLIRLNIKPDGLAKFFALLLQEEKSMGAANITMLSTHPDTAERLATIEALAKSARCQCQSLTYDWPAIRESVRKVSTRDTAVE